ncbi:hypothetical protein HXA35_01950 [Bacillus sp. A301a_S52]|nr:hypothetical protein [Bacillus sp. A301a_S52]
MIKKRGIILIICFAVLLSFFYVVIVDHGNQDSEEIEEVLKDFNPFLFDINIEQVSSRYAIASYNWGYPHDTKFGLVELKKNLFGWEIVKATSDRMAFDDWPLEASIMAVYNELSESVVLRGRVVVSDIEEIQIQTKDGTRYDGSDIKITDNYMWYFITKEDVDLTGATITVLSEGGEIEGELYVDDEWDIHY